MRYVNYKFPHYSCEYVPGWLANAWSVNAWLEYIAVNLTGLQHIILEKDKAVMGTNLFYISSRQNGFQTANSVVVDGKLPGDLLFSIVETLYEM